MSDLIITPTNVITGFLGVGKSTAILHLLEQKPADERWAILVNEFGEVGIDGSLFSGQESEDQGVFVREVPGGCMCCAAGLPMQIALNMLLSRAKPHRLLIEPTGLGHPREVLAILGAEHYRNVLDIRATMTLVDARKIHDSRYTEHSTFNQQLDIADIIVANKSDQYQPEDFPALLDYLENTTGLRNTSVYQVTQSAVQLSWLESPTRQRIDEPVHDNATSTSMLEVPEMPERGYLRVDNEGEGFFSRGWIFNPQWIFDARKLHVLLSGLTAERVKGVFITHQGVACYNKVDNTLTETWLDDTLDSRIECIGDDPAVFEHVENALLDCVTNS